jgi:hypothetical protein
MYRLEEGAILDECVPFVDEVGVLAPWQAWQGEDIQREMVDFCQSGMRYGMKTLVGMESMNALPALLFSDEAARRLAGCNAGQIRDGICRRGHTQRQGDTPPGPLGPETLTNTIVTLALAAMAAFLHWIGQELATPGLCTREVTGLLEGTDLETTGRYEGWGQVTRRRTITDKRGNVPAIEVTVYGWK